MTKGEAFQERRRRAVRIRKKLKKLSVALMAALFFFTSVPVGGGLAGVQRQRLKISDPTQASPSEGTQLLARRRRGRKLRGAGRGYWKRRKRRIRQKGFRVRKAAGRYVRKATRLRGYSKRRRQKIRLKRFRGRAGRAARARVHRARRTQKKAFRVRKAAGRYVRKATRLRRYSERRRQKIRQRRFRGRAGRAARASLRRANRAKFRTGQRPRVIWRAAYQGKKYRSRYGKPSPQVRFRIGQRAWLVRRPVSYRARSNVSRRGRVRSRRVGRMLKNRGTR